MQSYYKKIGWATDTHFELASKEAWKEFVTDAKKHDALLITGDIAQSNTWEYYLHKLKKELDNKPIWFVLGNHDCYQSSIKTELERLQAYSKVDNSIIALSEIDGVWLDNQTLLIGGENWWDGGYSSGENGLLQKLIMREDYTTIEELTTISNNEELKFVLNKLSTEFAEKLIKKVKTSFEKHKAKRIVLATHVPPYRENCTHFGVTMITGFLTHFSSSILGTQLREIMLEHTDKKMVVLTGHTHDRTSYRVLPNLLSLTGKSKLYKPKVRDTINLKDLF
jgi:Icc-related predicted phosphoesterase